MINNDADNNMHSLPSVFAVVVTLIFPFSVSLVSLIDLTAITLMLYCVDGVRFIRI